MKPCGWLWFRSLEMVYTYEFEPTDPDYHLKLRNGHGLSWLVFNNGRTGWYHRDKHSSEELGLSDTEIEKTEHVVAVLSLPLRRKGKQTPFAVLNFDAIESIAANVLEEEFEELRKNNNRELQVLAEQVRNFV